ncbi:MAG: hypothetical protein AB1397_05110 [bacterium]
MRRLLLFVFFYSYLIYPSYYIGGIKTKFFLFSLYLLLFWILTKILPKQEPIYISIPYLKYLLIPFFLAILCHLYFWMLPIPTLEDFQTYINIPALLLSNIYFYIPRWILVISSAFVFIITYLYISGKQRKIWHLLFIFGISLSIFVILFLPLTSIGKPDPLFRHPPIPKTLYLLGYIFFGINEWVGNFIQFFLLSLAGIYVGKITQLILLKKDSFSFVCGFLITIFFPTLFNFTNLCGLAPGELFFTTASFYYFLCFLLDNKEQSFFYSMSILGIGLLYERKILFLFLFILLVLRIKGKISISVLKYSLIPFLFGFPFIIVSYQYRNANLSFSWIEDPGLLLLNAKQIWVSLGPFITLFVIASFFFLKRFRVLFLSFFLLYYIFISSTWGLGSIRHAQPYYLILAIILSVGIAQLKRRLFLFLLILIMLYQAIFSSSPLLLNLSNYKSRKWTAGFGILPYRKTIFYIKENLKDKKIYAPMGCEPSYFYLAKYRIKERNWIRKPFLKDMDLVSLYKWCKENKIAYIVLPLTGEGYLDSWVDSSLCKEIYSDKTYFKLKKTFFFGENCLFLSEIR